MKGQHKKLFLGSLRASQTIKKTDRRNRFRELKSLFTYVLFLKGDESNCNALSNSVTISFLILQEKQK